MTRGPHPAVLFLHGGFAFAAEDLEMARPFQDNGFVVMVPVLRGENGQPGNFTLFYDEVDDVLAAAEALARLPDVNPARIYVTGHSAGGTLALLAAQATTRFRAVTSLSGALDQSHLASPDPHAGDLVRFDVANPKELEMRSPLAFAEELRCPTRYFYGSEELWAAQQSGELVRRASTTGIDVTAEQLIGDHFSYVPLAIQGTISFFRQH